jgi:PAS domain S-box-containing protein
VFEIALIVFIAALTGVGSILLTRPNARAISYWTWATFAIMGSGMSTVLLGDPRWTVVGFSLGTGYAVLLLVGAIVYAGGVRPRGLIGLGLLVGAGRGVAAIAGYPAIAHGLAVLIEPTAVAVAAALVYRANRGLVGGIWPRTVPPALVAVAALEVASSLSMISGAYMPQPLVAGWVVCSALLLALQIAAVSDHSRDAALARSLAELRESETRYRILSELSSDYSFAVRVRDDRSITWEWASSGLERITGFDREVLSGSGWFSLLAEEDRQDAFRQLDDILSGRSREMEFRILDRHGEEHWVHTVIESVANEGGETLMVGATRDVTQIRRAEEERRRFDLHMREVQRLESLGVLAGGIAHDFNNMLTVIRGNARLALTDLEAGGVPSERIERICQAADHATKLTEQMLTYSGRGTMQRQPLDLSELVHDMLDLLRASASEKTRLDPDLGEGLPLVDGDVTQIRQVVLNLVTNASEALGAEGGSIRVRTGLVAVDGQYLADGFGTADAKAGDYVCLEVSDTGQGITPEERMHIFEPFFSTKTSGQGLGLAAVLGIVTAHGGVIRIESTPGRGATFEVLLPCARAAARVRPEETFCNQRAGGRSILVVDDDEAVLEVTKEFLERAGFQVFAADGGRAGVEFFREHADEIDAVVLDLVMPGVGGDEAYVEMLRVRPDLHVVLTSGYDKGKAAERVRALGVAGYLLKPFEPEDLVASVEKALNSA